MDIGQFGGALGGVCLLISLFIAGAFWLSRTESKSNTAIKDIADLEAKVRDLEREIKSINATNTAVAKLETKLDITLSAVHVTLEEIKSELRELRKFDNP